MFNPEQNFDFFNPYDGLSNNWFGASEQECSFSQNLKDIKCIEMHNFNSKSTASFRVSEELLMEEIENTKHEGTIFIVSKLHKESQRQGSITIKDSSRPIESLKVNPI